MSPSSHAYAISFFKCILLLSAFKFRLCRVLNGFQSSARYLPLVNSPCMMRLSFFIYALSTASFLYLANHSMNSRVDKLGSFYRSGLKLAYRV